MSVGLQTLRAVIDHQSRNVFRTLSDQFFTEDEQPAWRFVQSYFDRYGSLPSVEVLAREQFHLPDAPGAVGYWRDELRNRAIFSAFNGYSQQIGDAVQQQDMLALRGHIENMVLEMRSVEAVQDTYTIVSALEEVMRDYVEARQAGWMRGVTYGWDVLDNVTGGCRGGDLATIVARPGLGKSYTLLRMATRAWQSGSSLCYVSMEMSAVESARRLLGIGSGVSADMIQRGWVSEWGEELLHAEIARVRDLPAFNMLVGDLSKSVRDVDAMIQEHGPDVVYVDASYLMRPTHNQGMKRFEQVSETIRELKSLATNRNVPIIQTVQFNRTQKADEEMSIDNIGNSDEIGQISSLVIGMKKGLAPFESRRRRYKVLKNRHGVDGYDFETNYLFEPFNMDVIEEQEDAPLAMQGEAPSETDWQL